MLAAEDVLPFWRSFPGRARRLMELQRNTQSLIAHASAARGGAAGTQTEGGAPEAAALLLWPSVRATQVRAAAAPALRASSASVGATSMRPPRGLAGDARGPWWCATSRCFPSLEWSSPRYRSYLRCGKGPLVRSRRM